MWYVFLMRNFFEAAVESILVQGSITLNLTSLMKKTLDGAFLNWDLLHEQLWKNYVKQYQANSMPFLSYSL